MLRIALVTAALAFCACNFDPLDRCPRGQPGDALVCPMPGVLDRAFDLELPDGWDGASALPLIYAFHGGGGRRSSAESLTCPDDKLGDAGCLSAKARERGYAIARPDGTGGRPFRNIRTWNAGGGTGEWSCVSGASCKAGVDDMRYLDLLQIEIERIVPIDTSRIYATGISNGGAISHRLACERSDRISAAAPVGGANQFAAAGGSCQPGTAILQMHGTEDPIWVYETSTAGGAIPDDKLKIGAEESTAAWAERNGCDSEPARDALPDVENDGTSSVRVQWQGCDGDVELIRIEGGGHTWPQGQPYLSEDTIGRVAQDFDADDLILDFFDAH